MRKILEQIVRQAGDMLLDAARLGTTVYEKKGVGNFVTDCDEETQRFLQQALKEVLPEAAFVGEEEGGELYRAEGLCLIADPIDGTANFIRGLGYSVVSLGLLEDGQPKIGVVYNPFSDELFSAERGCGATLNGVSIRVSERPLSRGLISVGVTCYQRDMTRRMFRTLEALFAHCEDFRNYGSAALDICQVAAGRLEAFVELRLSPWDYAGAACILLEAGGRISTAEGTDLPWDTSATVLAANAHAFDEALALCRAAQ